MADTGSGPWVRTSLRVLAACDPLLVVVGASAAEVAALVPPGVEVVVNERHSTGMGSSLALGLEAVARTGADAVLVMLVDLPDVTDAVAARLIALAAADPEPRALLVRAAYAGRPGHPVLLGRHHFRPVMTAADGDAGARDYLATRAARLVECGDLAAGRDVDTPEQRPRDAPPP